MKWDNLPRVVAVGNVLVLAGLGALSFLMERPKSPGADNFLYGWFGIIGGLALFWVWIFIANPHEWAIVKNGRLMWRRGHVLPRSGSVAVTDVKCVLVKSIVTPSNNLGLRNVIEYYVVLKDETKLKIPAAAVEHEVLSSMRSLNPYIEKRNETVPLSSRDPGARG